MGSQSYQKTPSQKVVAARTSLLEGFSGKFRHCWKILLGRKCYPCQGSGAFRQGKWLENRPRLRERSWIFSSKTATAFLSFSDLRPRKITALTSGRSPLKFLLAGKITGTNNFVYFTLEKHMSGGANYLPKFLPISFFRCISFYRCFGTFGPPVRKS